MPRVKTPVTIATVGAALAAFLATLVFGAVSAFGAESAQFDPIGYSPERQYFAFEEYGIQDGSGFAYSTIYVVNLETDAWVSGTPVRAKASDGDTTLHDIRDRARQEADTRLSGLDITVPTEIVAMAGDGDPARDGLHLSFGVPTPFAKNRVSGTYTLDFEIFKAPSPATCMEWFGDEPMGFALRLDDGTTTREVHRDDTLPRSRGCPVTYKTTAVVLPFRAQDISAAVALVSVYAHGFEGIDRRFLAIPLGDRSGD